MLFFLKRIVGDLLRTHTWRGEMSALGGVCGVKTGILFLVSGHEPEASDLRVCRHLWWQSAQLLVVYCSRGSTLRGEKNVTLNVTCVVMVKSLKVRAVTFQRMCFRITDIGKDVL